MNRTLWISVMWGLLCIRAAAGAPPVAQPIVVYSQDNKHFHSLNLIYGTGTANDYFDLQNGDAHPAFGTASGTATLAMYYDLTDRSMSLISVVGAPSGQTGAVVENITGVPRSAGLGLIQNSSEITSSHRHGTIRDTMNFGVHTDGNVLSSLQFAKFKLTVDLASESNVSQFRIADGDPNAGGQFVDLAEGSPIYLDRVWLGRHGHPHVTSQTGPTIGSTGGSGSGSGPAVPEPASLGLVAALSAILTARPRRR